MLFGTLKTGYTTFRYFVHGRAMSRSMHYDAHDFSFFSERHESGFEPVDDESFDFIVSEVEDLARELEFIGHRRIGDESIVGVERATEPEIHVELERMVFDGIDGVSLDVVFEVDFERDSVIVEVVEEIAVFA